MDELLNVMQEILSELKKVNGKIDILMGENPVFVETEISEYTEFHSLSEVCTKLNNIDNSVRELEIAINKNRK